MNAGVGLSFEQAPPLDVPLRFFLTAPWFLVLAAIILLWQGPADVLTNRWMPATLACVHLVTIGFMAQVMIGALLQILPVMVGVVVPHPRWVAAVIHSTLTLGALALAWAFLTQTTMAFHSAFSLLGVGFGVALWVLHQAVWRAPIANDTVIALRCALTALLITVFIGLLLGGAMSLGWNIYPLTIPTLTNVHAVWGLIGWTLWLIAGVAYQVVPMFQMTNPYPQWCSRWFVPCMALLLSAWLVAVLWGAESVAAGIGIVIAVGAVSFAGITIHLLSNRRRKVGDPTLGYWYLGMRSIVLSALLWCVVQLLPESTATTWPLEMIFGVLWIVGCAVTVINGMLYKIVPFLVWFHLQAQRFEGGRRPPHMEQLLPAKWIVRQYWAALATMVMLLAAVIVPHIFAIPAALLFGVMGAWIGLHLLRVMRVLKRAQRNAPVIDPA